MVGTSYVTSSGDMWDGIAYKVYPERSRGEMLVHKLMAANPNYLRTVIFQAGVVLTVPDIGQDIPDSLPPWKK